MIDGIWTLDTLMDEEQDKLASAWHEAYPRRGQNGPADKPWGQLDETYRESNRAAADHLDIKLHSIGLERRPKAECGENEVKTLDPDQAELLSKVEHARWCAERWLDGWRWGEEKDPKDKIHPDLVPWDKLPEAERKIDEVLVSQVFTALESIGQGAVPISDDNEMTMKRSLPAHS
ncbi:MAG: RyR domain-containing protein [Syntrophobacteraceae bacterium]